MTDERTCALCKYLMYDRKMNAEVCHNEQCENFGKALSTSSRACGLFAQHQYTDLTLKEALGIVTFSNLKMAYPSYFLRTKNDDWPFIALNFENNTDAILWLDALNRLFMEFLEIKERDGDFKKIGETHESK